MVGIPDPERRITSYPHELSGGMAQRVMIAMALACTPDLLIADEPTTALDVTIQAQILDLMRNLHQNLGTSIILITHDLGVVAEMCQRVAVMYAGEIVEETDVTTLFKEPLHPYTQGLIGSIPVLGEIKDQLDVIPGNVPNLIDLPPGCRFAPRCRARVEHELAICTRENPDLKPVSRAIIRCAAGCTSRISQMPELQTQMTDTLVEARSLTKHFPVKGGVLPAHAGVGQSRRQRITHHPARRDTRAGRRVGLRQNDHWPDAAAADRADRRPGLF